MPAITVVVPVYKVEPYLHRCVDSILEQTFPDFELVLVDDGSPDSCGAICDEYAAKDERIHVIHQQNGGLSAARNAGIDWAFSHSDSQWFAFVDSDDWVSEHYLSRMLESAEQARADLCVCDFAMEIETAARTLDDMKIHEGVMTGRDALEEHGVLKNWHYVIACNKLYSKKLFRDLRFPNGFINEDEATAHRIYHAAKTVVCIEDQLYHYRIRDNSIMGSGFSPKKLDILSALADRIRFAKKNGYPRVMEPALRLYERLFWGNYRPLLQRGAADPLHLKRASRATRSILPMIFKSDEVPRGHKVRMLIFSVSYRLYQRLCP